MGTIPTEFGFMSSLTQLYLDGNNIEGSIPSSLGTATQLSDLRLFDNRLRGTLPPSLGNLSLLRVLYIDTNFLSGTIPTEFGGMKSLQDFQVRGGIVKSLLFAFVFSVLAMDMLCFFGENRVFDSK